MPKCSDRAETVSLKNILDLRRQLTGFHLCEFSQKLFLLLIQMVRGADGELNNLATATAVSQGRNTLAVQAQDIAVSIIFCPVRVGISMLSPSAA